MTVVLVSVEPESDTRYTSDVKADARNFDPKVDLIKDHRMDLDNVPHLETVGLVPGSRLVFTD